MHKKLFALILAFVLLCNLALPGFAVLPDVLQSDDTAVPLSEEKVYCNATLEDDFADDRVLVVLNNDASTSLHTYSTSDFAGIGCTNVQNLTHYATAQVNAKLRNETAELQNTIEPNVITFAEFQEVDTENFHQILCLTLDTPGKQNVLDTIDALMRHPDVISAAPDYIVHLENITTAVTPNDPYRSEQWAIEKIQLRHAWGYTTGSSTVRVGIIDSGIDGTHPELTGKINTSLSRDFSEGYTQTVTSVTDPNGHGTHVAGIIAAATNNGTGISGACFNVELVSLRVLDSYGYGCSSGYYLAVDYARSQNIPILNMSVGFSEGSYTKSQNYQIFNSLLNYNGLIVCAAGNSSIYGTAVDIDSEMVYPACFANSGMLVVGASTSNDSRASFSNYGSETVDLFAPGEGILSCYPTSFCTSIFSICEKEHYENGYHYMDGTSMATPYVTGVAALILAKYPNLNVSQIKERIMEGVDPISALSGKCVSGGRLNAYKAVHPHSFGYVNNTVSHHSYGCICGITKSREEHTYEQIGLNLYCCTVCGYESDVLP